MYGSRVALFSTFAKPVHGEHMSELIGGKRRSPSGQASFVSVTLGVAKS